MASVTQRIKQIKQPYGGYLPVKKLKKIELTDGQIIHDKENVAPQVVGMVVDYLTRFMLTHDKEKSFDISLQGAKIVDACELLHNFDDATGHNNQDQARVWLDGINGNDDTSIKNAINLVAYDTALRAGYGAYIKSQMASLLYSSKDPSRDTLDNIRLMVHRSLYPFKKFSPLKSAGFTMPGGYTDIVTSGDGDYLSDKILWDFKVSKNKPNSKQTLQILMYWIMLKHSDLADDTASIDTIGLFNPRLNVAYTINVYDIDPEIIAKVEHDIIGYN